MYYDEFEGGVSTCLVLYNSYVSQRLVTLEAETDKNNTKEKFYDSDVFRSEKVVKFLHKINKFKEVINSASLNSRTILSQVFLQKNKEAYQ